MTQVRTHQQMEEIYQNRSDRGLSAEPYVVVVQKLGQILIFFGSIHTNDPQSTQWSKLDSQWAKFKSSENSQKIVFCEGSLRKVEGLSRDRAITLHGEAGLMCWLAQENNLPVESPEPDRTTEVEALHQQGFSFEQIINYYFARQMHQWSEQDYINFPDWQEYAKDFLAKNQSLHDWGGQNIDLDKALTDFKELTDRDFSVSDKQTLYDLSDPSKNPVASASGRYRDNILLEAITKRWHKGFDIFTTYGSGHAIILEPALIELSEQSDS